MPLVMPDMEEGNVDRRVRAPARVEASCQEKDRKVDFYLSFYVYLILCFLMFTSLWIFEFIFQKFFFYIYRKRMS